MAISYPGISIVIPFRAPSDPDERVRNLNWLLSYWKENFPGAEIIIGEDLTPDKTFSKSIAVNQGVGRSTGDVLIIADADCYLPKPSVLRCVEEIRLARSKGYPLWFVPYRKFYRLSNEATLRLLHSEFTNPYKFPDPLDPSDICNISTSNPSGAHKYGALVHILPREAFDAIGGWDEFFHGWGGEDWSVMSAIDTLYGFHKTLPTPVYHLWHPMLGRSGKAVLVDPKERLWEGQDYAGSNNKRTRQYIQAFRNKGMMLALTRENSGSAGF